MAYTIKARSCYQLAIIFIATTCFSSIPEGKQVEVVIPKVIEKKPLKPIRRLSLADRIELHIISIWRENHRGKHVSDKGLKDFQKQTLYLLHDENIDSINSHVGNNYYEFAVWKNKQKFLIIHMYKNKYIVTKVQVKDN